VYDFLSFRQKASTQGLQYDPFFCVYKGDSCFRVNTQFPKARRDSTNMGRTTGGTKKRGRPKIQEEQPHEVTRELFSRSKKTDFKMRLCGDLRQYARHEENLDSISSKVSKNGRQCAWCGEPCWTFYGLCKDSEGNHPFLHHCPQRGHAKGKICFTNYHNDMQFGLGKADSKYSTAKKVAPPEWKAATKTKQKQHAKMIEQIVEELDGE
jgi:hypothetical protein